MKAMCFIAITAALTASALVPVHAAPTLTRTFVSSAGNDSNACTISAPCATFQRAYSQTLPDGIVAALDPGKYGPLNIRGGITINGNGWAAITGPTNGIAVSISAGPTNDVELVGLEIDGAKAANTTGIAFLSGKSLIIANCVVRQFTSAGTRIERPGLQYRAC